MITKAAVTAGAERYQRIRQLGQGGMGVVYEVFDSVKQRSIALKTLRSDDPDLIYRLKREFRSLADVVHNNLVELYDLGSDERTSFYTMELVDGCDFLENARARVSSAWSFDEPRLRDSLAQLFRGVSALHAAGKIHRDIKPSNVLVARNGRVVLVDFGLVSDLGDLTNLTLTAHVVGTAQYMAPEQTESSGNVSEAADWYGVGVMLFEALTGRLPFEGSMLEVLRDKVTTSAPDPRELAADLPADLVELCVALLRREPGERPNGDEIAESLSQPPISGVAKLKARSPRARQTFGGREQELAVLSEEFERVLAGACRVVSVQGPSGIGKSAIVREFLERGAQRASQLVLLGGRCYPRESIPYKAVDGVIDQLSEYWRRLPRAEAMYLLPREPEFLTLAFPVLKRVRELSENALPPAVLEPQEARSRAVAALRETLQRLCRRVPLVLFLDDMQWVDADSTRLLRSLVDSADAPALLLLMASRSISEEDPVSAWVAPLLSRAHVMKLEPLSGEETRALIRRIAPAAEEQVISKLARDAAGSPFFAEALARHADRELANDSLDLEALLQRRVAERSALGRELAALASVAGQPLSLRVAARASAAAPDFVASELRSLHAEALTRDAGGSAADQFEMYHDRIREAVLATLDTRAQKDLHRKLALALEQESPLDHEACCRHFLAGSAQPKAMLHAAAAAAAAEHQLAFDRAARYYALCLTPDDLSTEAKCSLRARLATALANAGRSMEAAHEFLLAAELAEPVAGLRYEWRAAEEFLRSGHSSQGLETAEIVVRKLGLRYPKRPTGALLAGALRHAKNRLASRSARVRPHGPESEPLLRQIDVCAGIAQCIGYVAPEMSYYFQSLHVGLAFQVGEPVRLCRAFCIEATYAAIGGGQRARSEALLSRAREISSSVAEPKARGIVALTEGTTAFFRGDWPQAFERCATAEELLKRECTGVQWEIDTAMLYALSSLHYSGRIKQLSERVRPLEEAAASRRDMYALTILRAGLSHVVYLAEDAPDRVLGALESVMDAWPNEDLSVPRYWELMSRFHVHLYRGTPGVILKELRERRRQIDGSLPMKVQVTRVRIALARARSALAVAALGEDRASNVRAALRQAELLEAESTRWAAPLVDSVRAGAAALEGRHERAIELLERAETAFEAADMALEAQIARRRRGELLKGSGGSQLVAEADQWMSRQSIRNPQAFARVMAPGFAED